MSAAAIPVFGNEKHGECGPGALGVMRERSFGHPATRQNDDKVRL